MYLLFPLHLQIRLGTPKRRFQHQAQHNKLPSFFLLSGSQPEALITAQDCELLNCTSQILLLLHAFRLFLEENSWASYPEDILLQSSQSRSAVMEERKQYLEFSVSTELHTSLFSSNLQTLNGYHPWCPMAAYIEQIMRIWSLVNLWRTSFDHD